MSKYEVTYAASFAGIWQSVFFHDKVRAERECEKINAQARRGLRPFSEVVEVGSNCVFGTHTV